jgi:hypothetical protein
MDALDRTLKIYGLKSIIASARIPWETFTHSHASSVKEILFMTMIHKTLTQKIFPRFLFATAIASGLAMVTALAPAAAQFGNSADALKDPNQQNAPFSNSGSSTNGIFDLIHRAVLGPGKSLEEFNVEQSESLDAATEAFRAQQRAKLGQTATPVESPTPVVPPAPSN